MTRQVPLVRYLTLDPEPHLVAEECTACGARYFDERIACASCCGSDFTRVELPDTGVLEAFTIIGVAPPGVTAPFVAGIIDCGGTAVRANLVNVEPSPERVRPGMPLRLRTFSLGTDADGVEAIGFGFEPLEQDGT